jgi:hypothetical protein
MLGTFLFMGFTGVIFTFMQLVRTVLVQYQLDKMEKNGYNLDTFENRKKMFWKFWVWDAKQFTTPDTFLERL